MLKQLGIRVEIYLTVWRLITTRQQLIRKSQLAWRIKTNGLEKGTEKNDEKKNHEQQLKLLCRQLMEKKKDAIGVLIFKFLSWLFFMNDL